MPELTRYTSVALDPKKWVNAKTSAEAAIQTGIGESRLLQLADDREAPHYRVDGGPPLFHLPTLRKWIMENRLEVCDGLVWPMDVVQVVTFSGQSADMISRPAQLRGVDDLVYIDLTCNWAGVYFLVRDNRVVYVGQSLNVASRAACHTDKEYDKVFATPCPKSGLLELERGFIDVLLPEYNNCSHTKLMKRKNA